MGSADDIDKALGNVAKKVAGAETKLDKSTTEAEKAAIENAQAGKAEADAEKQEAEAKEEEVKEKSKLWEKLKGAGKKVKDKYKQRRQSFHAQATISPWKINAFIIAAIVVHFGVLMRMPSIKSKLIFNFSFAVLAYFFLIDGSERSDAIRDFFVVIVIYFTWEYIWIMSAPYLGARMQYFIEMYLLNPIYTPWWLYYAITYRIKAQNNRTLLSNVIGWAIFLFWFGLLISFLISMPLAEGGVLDQGQVYTQTHGQKFVTTLKKSGGYWGSFFDIIKKYAFNAKTLWYRRIDQAAGGDLYYAGKVENAQDEQLGVRIDNVQAADDEFHDSEKIVVYGLLKARTLDDGIKIKAGCYLGEKKDDEEITSYEDYMPPYQGQVLPTNEYLIFDADEQFIDCILPPGNQLLNQLKNSKKVTLTADFNFETMAYLKTYFMEEERLRGLLRQDIDPLSEFGIKEKNPISIFTNGPVKLAIGTKKPPFRIKMGEHDAATTESNVVRVGVTIDNNYGWQGKIKKLNQLIIEVPDSMVLLEGTCSHYFGFYAKADDTRKCQEDYKLYNSKPFIECAEKSSSSFDKYDPGDILTAKTNPDVEECVKKVCEKEFDGYVGYELNTDLHSSSLENIEKHKTFSCKFNVEDPVTLLGSAPVTTKYFRARARYDYEVEKHTSIKVQGLDKAVSSSNVAMLVSKFDDPKQFFDSVAQQIFGIVEQHAGNVDPCSILTLIVHTSGGMENYISGGRWGVMGLTPKLARIIIKRSAWPIADKIDEMSDNEIGSEILHNAYDNIRLGATLLNDIKSGNTEYLGVEDSLSVSTEDALVIFQDSMESNSFSLVSVTPKDLGAGDLGTGVKICSDIKPFECTQSIYYKHNTFLTKIKNDRQYCEDNKDSFRILDDIQEENPTNFWNQLSTVIVTDSSVQISPELEQKYDFDIKAGFDEDEERAVATFKVSRYGKTLFIDQFVIDEDDLPSAVWKYGEKYPFLRVKFITGSIEEQNFQFYFQDFDLSRVKVSIPGEAILPTTIWQDVSGVVVKGIYDIQSKQVLLFGSGSDEAFCATNIFGKINTCPQFPEITLYNINLLKPYAFNIEGGYDVSDAGKSGLFDGFIEFNPDATVVS